MSANVESASRADAQGHPHAMQVAASATTGAGAVPDTEPARRYFAREEGPALSHAFAARPAPHAGPRREAVAEQWVQATLARLLQRRRTTHAAAYLHIPFCETHCIYCGFFQNRYEPDLAERYVRSLLKELELKSDMPAIQSMPISALYLGGGTPTALSAGQLRTILNAARNCLPLSADCEITVEGRIHHFNTEKMEACLAGGANRFSLGVQTFDTELRRSMGRLDQQEIVLKTLQQLKHYRQAAVVVDLIYGFPRQNLLHWARDLEIVQQLDLDGVDLYALKLIPGTPLKVGLERHQIEPVGSFAMQAELFGHGVETLGQAGWKRLSVSHWGHGERERNRYNLMIKRGDDCFGFGPGGGGALFDHSLSNTRSTTKYLEFLDRGMLPMEGVLLPLAEPLVPRMIAGELECLELNLKALSWAAGHDLESWFAPLLEQWARRELITYCDGIVNLTVAGQFWQTNLVVGLTQFYLANHAEFEAPVVV
jgi:oxygen-independent coproporphyrinogen-3 oxidase